MKRYYLFLDELKQSDQFNHFCLAGCIIEASVYDDEVIPMVNGIKERVFASKDVILHEIEIRRAKDEPYKLMRNRAKREEFWKEMTALFATKSLFSTVGVAINCTEYHRLYTSDHKCDEYFIGLQILMENFTHFLECVNGVGSIMVESRNHKEDQRLQNHFHTLLANGTLFLDKNAMQKRLSTISFPLKIDNNIGIQLADFIPNPLARKTGGLKQKDPTLYDHIESKLYDGGCGLKHRFGLKVIP